MILLILSMAEHLQKAASAKLLVFCNEKQLRTKRQQNIYHFLMPKKLSSHIFSLILSMKVWVFLVGTKPQWCYMWKNKYTTHLHRFQTHCPLQRFTQPTWNEKKHDIILLFSSSTYLYTSHMFLLLLSPSSSFHINHTTNSQWVPPSSLKGPAADAEALKYEMHRTTYTDGNIKQTKSLLGAWGLQCPSAPWSITHAYICI